MFVLIKETKLCSLDYAKEYYNYLKDSLIETNNCKYHNCYDLSLLWKISICSQIIFITIYFYNNNYYIP